MKKLLLLPLLLLAGCGVWNKIDPNLATRLVKTHPRMQAVCDYAGGCQNVEVTCTRYDGTRSITTLQNTTFVEIQTNPIFGKGIYGIGYFPNDTPNFHQAVEDAISEYWNNASVVNTSHESIDVLPNSTSCDKDCTQ